MLRGGGRAVRIIGGDKMTMFLANAKIMHKVLAVLLLFGTLTVRLSAMLSWRIEQVEESYSGLVNSKLPATTQLIRMNRFATEMVQIGYCTVAFPASSGQQRGGHHIAGDGDFWDAGRDCPGLLGRPFRDHRTNRSP